MPRKGNGSGWNARQVGSSSRPQDIIARWQAGQSLDDMEPRSVTLAEPLQMTSKNKEIWRSMLPPLVHLDLASPPGPTIRPTPEFGIGQTVAFVAWLTFLTGRKLSPSRQGWLYEYSAAAGYGWVAEASFKAVAQEVPFDDFIQGSGDWIPRTFVLERKPEDEAQDEPQVA